MKDLKTTKLSREEMKNVLGGADVNHKLLLVRDCTTTGCMEGSECRKNATGHYMCFAEGTGD